MSAASFPSLDREQDNWWIYAPTQYLFGWAHVKEIAVILAHLWRKIRATPTVICTAVWCTSRFPKNHDASISTTVITCLLNDSFCMSLFKSTEEQWVTVTLTQDWALCFILLNTFIVNAGYHALNSDETLSRGALCYHFVRFWVHLKQPGPKQTRGFRLFPFYQHAWPIAFAGPRNRK